MRFSNVLMLTLFMFSGSIAAVSCAVIGIGYLGINFRLGHRDSIQTVGSQSPVVQKSRVPAVQECHAIVVQESRACSSDTANTEALQEPSAIAEPEETEQDVFVLLPTEEEETKKNPPQNQQCR